MGEGDGSPHPRGQRGEGQQDSSTPLRCARNDMWSGEEERDGFPPPSSLGQAPRGNDGSGCENDGLDQGARDGFPGVFTGVGAGNNGGGMGPRIREDNGWGRDGFPPPSSEGRLYARNDGLGARMGGGGRGWVPASARTTDGEGMDSRSRLHWGRLCAGITGVGARMTGGGSVGQGRWRDGRPQGSPLRRRELRVREFFAGVRMRGGWIRRLGRRERLLPRLPVGGVWRRR